MYEQSPSAPTERRKVGYLVVFAENGAAFLLGPYYTMKHLKLRYEAQKGRKAVFMTYEQDPGKAKDEFQVAMANQQP